MFISTSFFGFMAVLLSVAVNQKTGSLSGVLWARSAGYLTPVFVSVTGRKNIDKKQSYVIVSNHQSVYDIFMLYGWLGIDFKWVMKQELRNIPVLGVACEKVGHIFIDRSDGRKAIESINTAKKLISGGISVIFFPEGTRSYSDEVGQFKKGAFRFACDTGLPILPVTIIGSRHVLPKKTMDVFPGSVKMIIHEPVETSRYEDISELIAAIRNTVREPFKKKKGC